LAKFAYNNLCHLLSHDTLFQLLYGIDLQIDFLIEDVNGAKDPKAHEITLALKDR
jgi:hypothetical protein